MTNPKQTEAKRLAAELITHWEIGGGDLAHLYVAAAELLRQEAEILRLQKLEEEWMRLSQDEGKAEKEIVKLREQLENCKKVLLKFLHLAHDIECSVFELSRTACAESIREIVDEAGTL